MLERFSTYRHGDVKIVNRIHECEKLLDILQRGAGFIHVIYGPRGCGKTFFSKAFTYALKGEESVRFTLIDHENPKYSDISEDLQSSLKEGIINLVQELPRVGDVAKFLLRIYNLITEWIRSRKVEYYVFILDEARNDSALREFVDVAYNSIQDLIAEGIKPTLIIITSYDTYVNALSSTGKCIWYFMWNLDKDSTIELCQNLGVKDPELCERIFKITSGNPRAIVQLIKEFKADIKRWITFQVESVLNNYELVKLIHDRERNEIIREICNDIDSVLHHFEIQRILIENNLVIKVPESSDMYLSGKKPLKNKDLGIGVKFAWQMPIYRYIIETLAISRELSIEDIVNRILNLIY